MITTLRPFQELGVRGIYHFHGRAILADEQGLGKTLQALSWIFRLPKRRPVLIVTPSSIKYAWQAEADLHFRLRATVLEGQGPKRGVRRLQDKIIILNYDILHFWLPVLLQNQPEIVIFDEAHYISNHRSRRSRASKIIADGAASVVALTGTPMTNRPIQLWSILNVVRPDLFPSFNKFAWKFCEPKKTPWGWTFPGAENKKELARILRSEVMIRRLKKDVAPEIPKKIHKVIPLRVKNMKEYYEARDNFLDWLRSRSPAKAARAEKAQAMVKVGYLFRLCAELKLKWLVQFLKEFHESNPGEKAVGLTMHTFVIKKLQATFPRSVVVNGQVTGWKRTEAVRKFKTNKKIDWLWGNWKAAGAGLNLQTAHNLICLDLPWTSGDRDQGVDRIHRIGQTKECLIQYPILQGTVEEKWLEVLNEQKKTINAILNGRGGNREDAFINFLERLRNE